MTQQHDSIEQLREAIRSEASNEMPYLHPGFGNYHDPEIVVIEESPSWRHFRAFPSYEAAWDARQYRGFYEEEYRGKLLQWRLFTKFLYPVCESLGVAKDEVLDRMYLTSAVKRPVEGGSQKTKRLWDAFDETWELYLRQELEQFNPNAILTVGGFATEATAEAAGFEVDRGSVRITDERWWGESTEFVHDPPLLHSMHWGAVKYNPEELEPKWEQCLAAVQSGLSRVGFGK